MVPLFGTQEEQIGVAFTPNFGYIKIFNTYGVLVETVLSAVASD